MCSSNFVHTYPSNFLGAIVPVKVIGYSLHCPTEYQLVIVRRSCIALVEKRVEIAETSGKDRARAGKSGRACASFGARRPARFIKSNALPPLCALPPLSPRSVPRHRSLPALSRLAAAAPPCRRVAGKLGDTAASARAPPAASPPRSGSAGCASASAISTPPTRPPARTTRRRGASGGLIEH